MTPVITSTIDKCTTVVNTGIGVFVILVFLLPVHTNSGVIGVYM